MTTTDAPTLKPSAVGAAPIGTDWVALSSEPLELAAATRWASVADCGAVVAFEGIVRDHSHDGPGVTTIDYEAHPRYAVTRMREIAAAARHRWPELGRIVLWHRTGLVPLTESSVVVVVSAAHRKSAFDPARFCIDVVKECVPVWKHEHRGGHSAPMLDGANITDVSSSARAWFDREQAR